MNLILGIVAMAVMLGLTVLALRAASRFFAPNDPKRAVVNRVIVWVGTALLVMILLALRQE